MENNNHQSILCVLSLMYWMVLSMYNTSLSLSLSLSHITNADDALFLENYMLVMDTMFHHYC
jgi:hypothetical protein